MSDGLIRVSHRVTHRPTLSFWITDRDGVSACEFHRAAMCVVLDVKEAERTLPWDVCMKYPCFTYRKLDSEVAVGSTERRRQRLPCARHSSATGSAFAVL